jgi:hypothetical protein
VLKIILSGLFVMGAIIITFLSYPLARKGYGIYLLFFYLAVFIGGMFMAGIVKNITIIVQVMATFIPGLILFIAGIVAMHGDQPPAPLPKGACPRCRGHGWFFTTAPVMDGSPRERAICPVCGGTGKSKDHVT